MHLLEDLGALEADLETEELAKLGELGLTMGLKIRCQKSEIFEKMHRV